MNAVVDGEGVLRVEGLRSLSPGEYRVVMMVEKNVSEGCSVSEGGPIDL